MERTCPSVSVAGAYHDCQNEDKPQFLQKAAGNIDLPEGPDNDIDQSDSCCDL